jgi:hypothetical protein
MDYCKRIKSYMFKLGCDGCAYEPMDNGFEALAYRACVERNKEDGDGER